MRLTNADKLTDDLLKIKEKTNASGHEVIFSLNDLLSLINGLPTAYDLDKVVEELEKLADENYKAYYIAFNSDDRAEYDAYTNAIEIVKQGGVSDDVCEWKVFDNSLTDEPQWVYETTCGKYVGEEHTSKEFVYCPYCSKKIKVVE